MSGNHRPYLRSTTKEMVNQNAQYTQMNEHGQIVDPNNGQVLGEDAQYGHVTGMENRGFVSYSNQAGMPQSELNDTTNNAGLYQLESPEGNMGHGSEEPDPNETALNTANYCYLENPQYQETTYINPPSAEGEPWTLTTENTQTGVESQVGTFTPDLGEVTPESQAAIHSAAPSYSSEDSVSYGNDMSDFGAGDSNADATGSSASAGESDGSGSSSGDDSGMTM